MNVVHPEFTRPVDTAGLGQGKALTLAATEAECVGLMRRFDLENLSLLEAEVVVRPILGDARRADWVQATGKLRAEYAQRCVITLQPVLQKLDLDLNLTFAPMGATADQIGSEIIIDPHQLDDPDPIENGKIDLGEAIAQQFAMALDPYPKAPGAEISPQYQADGDGKIRDFNENHQQSSPFADLTALKSRPKNQG